MSTVVTGWALTDEAVAAYLESNHSEPVTDSWVAERATQLAIEGWGVIAAVHLLRYGDGVEVGEGLSARVPGVRFGHPVGCVFERLPCAADGSCQSPRDEKPESDWRSLRIVRQGPIWPAAIPWATWITTTRNPIVRRRSGCLQGIRNEARAGTQDPIRRPPTRPSAGPPASEGSEGEEAGKVEVLRTIGGRSTERNVTLLFGAKDA